MRTQVKPQPRIRVENVVPQVDCGRFPVKRTVGERLEVTATIFRDGADILVARLLYRGPGARRWSSTPLEPTGNDRFTGSFEVTACGRWEYAVEAWTDRTATWRDELQRKVKGGQKDLTSELAEGELLLGIEGLDVETALESTVTDKHGATKSTPLTIEVDREIGRFGAWYELFPRSFGGFAGVEQALPRLAEMGFDVIYLPPIHPIGKVNRKGPNNTLVTGRDDPGSPVGDRLATRAATTPSTPTSARSRTSTRSSQRAARARPRGRPRPRPAGCARPPVGEEHPEWFTTGPTARIAYAENPPKKYQDIYPSTSTTTPTGSAQALLRRRAPLDRPRRPDLPGRQPAHQAGARSGSG